MVSKNYWTCYKNFELRVVGQQNFGIVLTKVRPNVLTVIWGPGRFESPKQWEPRPFLMKTSILWHNIELVKAIQTFDTSNKFLRRTIAEWRHFNVSQLFNFTVIIRNLFDLTKYLSCFDKFNDSLPQGTHVSTRAPTTWGLPKGPGFLITVDKSS